MPTPGCLSPGKGTPGRVPFPRKRHLRASGAPPYARLTLPPMPSAVLIVNLGAPFRIRAGTDIERAEYADGCVVTMPTRRLGVRLPTPDSVHRRALQAVGAFGAGPPLLSCETGWPRRTGPDEMLTLLEEELMRRLCETADLSVAAGVSSTQLAQRFKELIGVTPKRLARTYRFAATVFSINPAGPTDWRDLAGGAGYFGQAPFGHEFRAFTGLTPSRYVEVRRRFLREHPGHALDGWPLPAD